MKNWDSTKSNLTSSSDGQSATSYTKNWDRGNTQIANGSVSLEMDDYGTGGIKVISSDYPVSGKFIKQAFISRDPIEERLKWLIEMPHGFSSEADVDEISIAFSEIDKIVKKSDRRAELDEVIQFMAEWDISYEIQVNILRYTYPIHSEIPKWKSAVSSIISKLEKIGEDPSEILLGIK